MSILHLQFESKLHYHNENLKMISKLCEIKNKADCNDKLYQTIYHDAVI